VAKKDPWKKKLLGTDNKLRRMQELQSEYLRAVRSGENDRASAIDREVLALIMYAASKRLKLFHWKNNLLEQSSLLLVAFEKDASRWPVPMVMSLLSFSLCVYSAANANIMYYVCLRKNQYPRR
jgi:lipopolysaccharide export LptBFGC system permease protein LptF